MATGAPISDALAANLRALAEMQPALAKALTACLASDDRPLSVADAPLPWQPPAGRWDYPYLLIFCGLSSAEHLLARLADCPPSVGQIVLCEPELRHVHTLFQMADLTGLIRDPRVHWFVGSATETMTAWWYTFLSRNDRFECAGRVEWHAARGSGAEAAAYYGQFARAFAEANHLLLPLLQGTVQDDFAGVQNIIGNSAQFGTTPVVDPLRNLCAGYPGVVVATGPSLSASLPLLSDFSQHAVVCSCDSAAPLLMAQQIVPHFISCLERVPATWQLIQQLPPMPDSVLVASPVVNPLTIRSYPGPCAFMPTVGTELHWARRYHAHHCGNSAATMAFALLNYLGCSPIILVGQDLAFDRATAHSHATGAHPLLFARGVEERQEATSSTENFVPGNDGTPILTSPIYRSMALHFGALIARTGARCFNAIPAHAGMAIPGTAWVDPQRVRELFGAKMLPSDLRAQIRARLATDVRPTPDQLAAARAESIEALRMIEEIAEQQRAILRDCATWPAVSAEDPAHESVLSIAQAMMNECLEHRVSQRLTRHIMTRLHMPIICALRDLIWNGQPRWKNYPAICGLLAHWFEAVALWNRQVRITWMSS